MKFLNNHTHHGRHRGPVFRPHHHHHHHRPFFFAPGFFGRRRFGFGGFGCIFPFLCLMGLFFLMILRR